MNKWIELGITHAQAEGDLPEHLTEEFAHCDRCGGTGYIEYVDWVPYGMGNVPMRTTERCDCYVDGLQNLVAEIGPAPLFRVDQMVAIKQERFDYYHDEESLIWEDYTDEEREEYLWELDTLTVSEIEPNKGSGYIYRFNEVPFHIYEFELEAV